MKIFYSEEHKKHSPPFEIFDGGEKVPNFEMPERMTRIVHALKQTDWAEFIEPQDFGLDPILAVHDKDYIDFLRTAYDEWKNDGAIGDKTSLLPATFPPAGWRRKPQTLLGRAGYYMMDLSAPITDGTYQAALASANCALSAAKSVSLPSAYPLPKSVTKSTTQSVSPSAYPLPKSVTTFALCRPPGHHSGRANCGGYCYINNAAVAANWLSTKGKTALLDVDYHAGNGTQDIFYERGDVLTISIHGDPAMEYPYFSGYADETGSGGGAGLHWNYPLSAGTDDASYLSALDDALAKIRAFAPQYLVVSAGMDIYENDPLGKFKITRAGISQIAKRIAGLHIQSLIVMEGGYNNDDLGKNVVAFLTPFTEKE